MQFLPQCVPNIHPIIVHLPIAALLLAVFFDLLSLIFKRQEWLSKAAISLYVIVAIGAILAVFTGEQAAKQLMIPKSMYHDIGEHAEWGKATAWFFGIYALLRLFIRWRKRKKSNSLKFGVFLISLVGVFLLIETGDHGAKLVFKHGIGTIALKQKMIREQKKKTTIMASIPTLHNGGWIWTPGPGSPSMLISDFSWYKGGPQDLNSSTIVEERDTVLSVNPDNKMVIIGFGKPVQHVKAEIEFKSENFTGEVGLVNQIQDNQDYNFMIYNDGNVSLGSLTGGNRNIIMGKTTSSKNGWVKMTVTYDKGRVDGAIDGKQLMIANQKINNSGAYGILINGKGLLLIRRIDVEQITDQNSQ